MAAIKLTGPPSIDRSQISAAAHGGETTVAAVTEQTKKLSVQPSPLLGLTENHSPTFLSTGNPCLDFFFHVVPDTPAQDLIGLLELAWDFDPLMALKLICNLRGVRGTGKSDKEGFYMAAIWLHYNHPKTLSGNLKALSEFGYFKDFPEILFRVLEGPFVRKIEKEQRMEKSRENMIKKMEKLREKLMSRKRNRPDSYWTVESDDENDSNEGNEREDVEFENAEQKKRNKIKEREEEILAKKEEIKKSKEDLIVEKEKCRALRKQRELNKAVKALEKYNTDTSYRLLHDKVSELFAEMLKSDVEKLSSGKLMDISLAAKWCPTIDSSYDKSTLICENVARRMFPRDKYPEYEGLNEVHYAYRVRDRLRKEVLVPLHKALELPEVYMSANKWNLLPYKRVASIAMKNYKKLFAKHDKERFDEFLKKVKSGEAKIAAGALLPHEIVKSLEDDDGGEVAELQWKRMVDDLAKKGKLNNCIAICDVSGSMSGIPMEVCVALGTLISELSEEPWKGKVITFSSDPQLHKVEGETLREKTEFVRRMDWGMNTNFQRAFEKILDAAVEGNVSEIQMIKRVFVFSDMEFDQASEIPWETDYQAIQRKFREKGFETVPEIVFWNLRDSRSIPVAANQSGVALVSGFSKNLLTLFLENGGIVNPVDVMELAIAGEEYKKLAVFD